MPKVFRRDDIVRQGVFEAIIFRYFGLGKMLVRCIGSSKKILYHEINFLDPGEFQLKFLTGQSEVFI
jgi:hypothetical protein